MLEVGAGSEAGAAKLRAGEGVACEPLGARCWAGGVAGAAGGASGDVRGCSSDFATVPGDQGQRVRPHELCIHMGTAV